jgi:hypothetical protein
LESFEAKVMAPPEDPIERMRRIILMTTRAVKWDGRAGSARDQRPDALESPGRSAHHAFATRKRLALSWRVATH